MSDTLDFEQQLAQLQRNYIAQLSTKHAALAQLWQQLSRQWQASTAEAFYQIAHEMAGSGSTFGVDALSQSARAICTFYKPLITRPLTVPELEALTSLTDGLFNVLAHYSAAEATPQKPSHQADYSSLVLRTLEQQQTLYIYNISPASAGIDNLILELQSAGFNSQFCDQQQFKLADEEEKPVLIVVDLAYLPENFSDFQSHFASDCNQSEIPKLVFSQQDNIESRLQAVNMGGNAFLSWPVSPDRLIKCLRQYYPLRSVDAYRVLIVEDNHEQAEYYKLVLQRAGVESLVVSDPVTTLDGLTTFRPDLILLDMYMPSYSGLELAKVIRQHEAFSGLPIVFLSAETSTKIQYQAREVGADDFLVKPLSEQNLLFAVISRVRRSRYLQSLMSNDSLTGLLSHESLLSRLRVQLELAKRYQRPVTYALIDLDHFKQVNDTYGHLLGDEVLNRIAILLERRLRNSDIIGRYGGEEFSVIFPDTEPEGAKKVLENILSAFREINFGDEQRPIHVTFSAGIAYYPGLSDYHHLLDAADQALYQAKGAGRNQIKINSEQ